VFFGLCVIASRKITYPIGAQPIGKPGCPELLLLIASIARNRTVLMQSLMVSTFAPAGGATVPAAARVTRDAFARDALDRRATRDGASARALVSDDDIVIENGETLKRRLDETFARARSGRGVTPKRARDRRSSAPVVVDARDVDASTRGAIARAMAFANARVRAIVLIKQNARRADTSTRGAIARVMAFANARVRAIVLIK